MMYLNPLKHRHELIARNYIFYLFILKKGIIEPCDEFRKNLYYCRCFNLCHICYICFLNLFIFSYVFL